MRSFKPRAVPASRCWAWALEAFSLVTERWYWHVPLALALAFTLSYLPRLFRVALGLSALALFALLTLASAYRYPLRQVLSAHAGALLRITAAWLFALALAVLTLAAMHPATPGPNSGDAAATVAVAPFVPEFAAGADLLETAAVVVAGPGAIFLLALLLFVRIPLVIAIDLSAEAVALNRFVIALGLAMAGLLVLLAGWTGLTVVVALPWSGALIFVAYRDVFLGEAPAETAPQASKALVAPSPVLH